MYLSAWSAKFGDVPEILPTSNLSGTGLVCLKIRHWWNLPFSSQRASFAASTQNSGDWLFALSIASCGLQLDDGGGGEGCSGLEAWA